MEFEELELERLEKEKKKAQRKNNLKEVAQLCNVIGELKAKFGRFEDAIEDHQMELHLSEALDDSMGTAIANRKIGECYCELGKFDLALKHQHRHLELAESEHSDIEQQRAWATIGRTYLYQAEAIKTPGGAEAVLRKGEDAFMKSLEVCERLKRSIKNEEYMEMKARLFLNLGLVYDNKRDEKQCTEYMKRAIMIAEKHNLAEDLYRCQFCLSGIYQRNGKPSQALRFLEEALKCARKMKDKVLESEVLVSKAQ
ncbi:tonsoku-like protein, partial [Lingula anatina]|uniref:Tonsoku-like protein n=1 Tax=Lingula anatina TaxID=7574 RepID=A0A1S3JBQ7_LINAN